MRRKCLSLSGLLILALTSLAPKILAQAVYGSIVGTVVDAGGGAVPGAKVTILNMRQGVSFTTTTNESGNYEQTHLIAGAYTVKVEKQGFQAYVQGSVQVSVDAVTQVNATLQVGAVTETVNVTVRDAVASMVSATML